MNHENHEYHVVTDATQKHPNPDPGTKTDGTVDATTNTSVGPTPNDVYIPQDPSTRPVAKK